MKLKCFGIAREIIAKDELILEDGNTPTNVSELRSWISSSYPEMNEIKGFMIAVDQEYASDDTPISSNSEIAIIPPVSGG